MKERHPTHSRKYNVAEVATTEARKNAQSGDESKRNETKRSGNGRERKVSRVCLSRTFEMPQQSEASVNV